MSEIVKPTQVDRYAAAFIYDRIICDAQRAEYVREGRRDEDWIVQAFARHRLSTLTSETAPVIDLDRNFWESLVKAASESNWIPPEYFANDWVSDCADFLRKRLEDAAIEKVARAIREHVRGSVRIACVDGETTYRRCLDRITACCHASTFPEEIRTLKAPK